MQLEKFAPVLDPAHAFTKAEFLKEVRRSLEGIGELMNALHGERGGPLDDEGVKERLRSAYICRVGEVVYDYGVEGVWPDPTRAGVDTDGLFLDFMAFSMSARVAAELYGTEVPICAEKSLAMAYLRAGLDFATLGQWPEAVVLEDAPENFTLFHIAVLAQMTEKSVRNATQPSANDRLHTIKVGNRTMVEPPEALRWLKGRRGFTPTTLPASSSELSGRPQP